MIGKSGVKVLDFGLARSGRRRNRHRRAAWSMGTPAYMAPEQREGKPADARTDIYAFGCVLYEMLTGDASRGRSGGASGAQAGNNRKPVSGRRSRRDAGNPLPSYSGNWRRSRQDVDARGHRSAAATSSSRFTGRRNSRAKDTVVLGEFENKTGDPVFDRNPSPGLVGATGTVPVPDSRLGSTDPTGTAFHEPAARDAAHSGGRAGDLRANRRHRGSGRLDCKPRKPVRLVATRQELPQRRHPWPGAGAGGKKGRGPECAHAGLRFKSGRGWASRWPPSKSTRRRWSRQPRRRSKL